MRTKRDLVEADLDRYFHRDLRDLWRFDEYGCRKLTHRMIYVRITNGLPSDSALARDANDGKTPWSLEHHLLADIWGLEARQLAGKKAPKDHPARPKRRRRQTITPEREAKLRAARRRRAQIQRRRGLDGKEA